MTVREADVWLHCEFDNVQSIQWYQGVDTGTLIGNSSRFVTIYRLRATMLCLLLLMQLDSLRSIG